jgi:crotonobetainyl-CoA:carnitine CoA-transferase CaiB-like acyl-CoA transferase
MRLNLMDPRRRHRREFPSGRAGDRRPELATSQGHATAPARSKYRDVLNAAIGNLTEKKSTEAWVSELNAAGVPGGPIYAIDQMFNGAQVKHLGIA